MLPKVVELRLAGRQTSLDPSWGIMGTLLKDGCESCSLSLKALSEQRSPT